MPNRTARCITVATLAIAFVTHGVHAQTPAPIADRYELATAAFRTGHMNEAFGRFIDLANKGHAPSIEIALFMYEHGPVLFGKEWELAPYQLKGWGRARERMSTTAAATGVKTVNVSK